MDQANAQSLAHFFTALCDPTRLRLLSLMADGAVSVGYLAEATGDSQPKVSRHLAFLRGADLVAAKRNGKNIYYELRWPAEGSRSEVISAILRNSPKGSNNIYADAYGNPVQAGGMEAATNEIEIHLL